MDPNPAISPIPETVNRLVINSRALDNLTRGHLATPHPVNHCRASPLRREPRSGAKTADPAISPAKTVAMIVVMIAAVMIVEATEAGAAVADAGAGEVGATTKLVQAVVISRNQNMLRRHLQRRDPLRRVHTNHRRRQRKSCRLTSSR
jgi:hypothetical protein